MPPEKRVLLEPAGSGGKDHKRAGTCPEMASRPCKRSRLAGLEAPDVLIRIMELAAARERTGYWLLKILQAIEGVLRVTGGQGKSESASIPLRVDQCFTCFARLGPTPASSNNRADCGAHLLSLRCPGPFAKLAKRNRSLHVVFIFDLTRVGHGQVLSLCVDFD